MGCRLERRDKRRDGHNHFRAVVYDPARQIRVALRMPLAGIPLYHQIAAHALEIAEPAQLPEELSNPADPRAAAFDQPGRRESSYARRQSGGAYLVLEPAQLGMPPQRTRHTAGSRAVLYVGT